MNILYILDQKINSLKEQRHEYIIHTWLENKQFKGTKTWQYYSNSTRKSFQGYRTGAKITAIDFLIEIY